MADFHNNGQAHSHPEHAAHAHGHHHEPTAWELLKKLSHLVQAEKKDIWVLVTYSIISGLLSLVVPLSSQAIVNAVQLGVVTPQLIVLCVVIGLGMLLMGTPIVCSCSDGRSNTIAQNPHGCSCRRIHPRTCQSVF
ncbi:MAG: hypothetical protein MUF71_10140 [Candidatus Kapabacteria bacterium]|nr:hypothetical protein [Candidatus Kapabacteria bacterium]